MYVIYPRCYEALVRNPKSIRYTTATQSNYVACTILRPFNFQSNTALYLSRQNVVLTNSIPSFDGIVIHVSSLAQRDWWKVGNMVQLSLMDVAMTYPELI